MRDAAKVGAIQIVNTIGEGQGCTGKAYEGTTAAEAREEIKAAADAHDFLPLTTPFANNEGHASVDDPTEVAVEDGGKVERVIGVVDQIAKVEMTYDHE